MNGIMTDNGLYISGGTSTTSGFRRALTLCGMITAAVSALVLLVPLRQNACALVNRLFLASESVNSYAYQLLTVPDGVSCAPAAYTLCAGITGILLSAAAADTAIPMFIAALSAAGFQVYFGLALPDAANAALFAFAGCRLIKHGNIKAALNAVILAALTAAVVMLVWPGVNADIEELSERARDSLSEIWQNDSESSLELPEAVSLTRPENLRSLVEGSDGAVSDDLYQLVTVEQVEYSKPRGSQLLRIIALCLAIPLVLLLPFAPFAFMNARKQRAVKTRGMLLEGTCGEQINAVFQRVTRWLDLFSEGSCEALYTQRFDKGACTVPETYTARYRLCAAIWQEAVYSGHGMNAAQAAEVLSLLDETEETLYEKAGRLMRFRLRYVYCLYCREKQK